MKNLAGKVALVTGASRGIGKGIALGLGEAGATVYLTGRTRAGEPGVQGLDGTIDDTARAVCEIGGKGIAFQCDHTDDSQVRDVFDRIEKLERRLDILVNSAWGGYEGMFDAEGEYVWEKPFWEQPSGLWHLMFAAGVRAKYVASRHAARMMIHSKDGLIVNLSHWAARKYSGNVCYGISKAATDKFSQDMAADLKPYGITAISLYPGLVRTERVMRASEFLDLSNSESPQFLGRVIAALYNDRDKLENSGQAMVAAQLGLQYRVTDLDGRQPVPLDAENA